MTKKINTSHILLCGFLLFCISFLVSKESFARDLGCKWINENNPVTFDVNFNDVWKNAIIAGMNTWNSVDSKVPMSVTSDGNSSSNDITAVNDTTVTWVGKMFPTTYPGGGWTYLSQADISFNLRYSFSSTAEVGKYDIQSVATHELGHAIGIAHCHDSDSAHLSSDSTFTMYNYSFTNSTIARTLESYDINSKTTIY